MFVTTPLYAIWLGIAVFLVFSAFFSASETALFSIPRERIVHFQLERSGEHRRVYELLRNGQRTLLLILLGNLFVNITIAGLIHSLVRGLLAGGSLAVTMGLATAVIVIFGELLPKNIALKHNERIALWCAPILSGMALVMWPLLQVIHSVNSFFLMHLSLRLRRPSPFVTIDELKTGVIASRARGAISTEEQDMIVGLLERGSVPVRRYMVHRSRLSMLGSTGTVAAALEEVRVLKKPYVAVYNEKNTAEVFGIVPAALLLRSDPGESLGKLVQPLPWVSEIMEVAEVVGILLEKGSLMAGVADEYGSFGGVVELSHSLFKVVSPLLQQAETDQVTTPGKRARVFSGETLIDTLDEWLPPALLVPGGKSATLNGVLTNHLGLIPQQGDKFAIDDWNFYIIKSSPIKIESVLIRKKELL